jgi:hypothetical protein
MLYERLQDLDPDKAEPEVFKLFLIPLFLFVDQARLESACSLLSTSNGEKAGTRKAGESTSQPRLSH